MCSDPNDEPTVTGESRASPERMASGPPGSRLGKLASFSGLGSDALSAIESSMVERRFGAGASLMRQGDEGDCLMVIREGEVEVAVTIEEERHVLKRAGGGEVLGEMALLTREPRTASVVAVTPVRALVLPVEAFHRLARAQPALAEVLSRLTAQRLGGETRDALSGKIFHGYRIRRRLGRGGMAVVYEGEEVATGRRVAIKMMSHRLVFRASSRRRFQHEADIIESFDHENIARMLGRFEAFHTFFIVMEYCDGSSLEQVLAERGPIEVPDVRRILGQLASALSYAHARRVVHCDIKPSNLMVSRDGIVKLLDFGVAAPPARGTEACRTAIVGTLPYMAPEQLAGRRCGVAADIFAMGGLAWEMLAGKPLFSGEDVASLHDQHLAFSPPDVASIVPGVAGDLREFLLRSLARDPDDRTVSLREVASWAGRVSYADLMGHAR